ncbi:hypothetical protein [Pseudonocardia pini]|uniref:hypothetical protein n=1 Tax=Pseudonocardia pini TaxID=2758030 RepID=UPI0015F08246|nr:hypothetical protein [Pseudonocardia pini]
MLVRTDDEVYRVDSVWLGPPRATFPWRARYVSYGVGLLVMIAVMFVQRRIGIGLDFFSVAWAVVITVLVTRFLGKKIDYERPLGQVTELFRHEVTGPRRRRTGAGGPVRFAHVRTHRTLPGSRWTRSSPTPEAPRPEVVAPEPVPVAVPAQAAVVAEAPAPLRDITPVRATPRRVPAQPWATAAERNGRNGHDKKGGRRGRA